MSSISLPTLAGPRWLPTSMPNAAACSRASSQCSSFGSCCSRSSRSLSSPRSIETRLPVVFQSQCVLAHLAQLQWLDDVTNFPATLFLDDGAVEGITRRTLHAFEHPPNRRTLDLAAKHRVLRVLQAQHLVPQRLDALPQVGDDGPGHVLLGSVQTLESLGDLDRSTEHPRFGVGNAVGCVEGPQDLHAEGVALAIEQSLRLSSLDRR